MSVNTTNNTQHKESPIVTGFKWGLGASSAAVVVGTAVGAAKAAWVYETTIAGAETGMAVAGPIGGIVGGAAGAITGMFV